MRPYREEEWRDSLVIVESGIVELECEMGRRVRFTTGSILFLVSLPIRRLHNPGTATVVLLAVARRPR